MKLSLESLTKGGEEMILGLCLVLYILSNIRPPEIVAKSVDSILGKLLIFCVIMYLFVKRHFILGLLAIWAFYDLMRKSLNMGASIDSLKRFMPSEEKKATTLTALNQFPYTLEQEMVSKMTTSHFNTGSSLTQYSWKPNLGTAFRDSEYVKNM